MLLHGYQALEMLVMHLLFAMARHGVLRPRDPDTLYGWVQISEEGGVAGLRAHQHEGRPLEGAPTSPKR